MAERRLMFTGHRPHKLGGFGPSDTQTWVRGQLSRLVVDLRDRAARRGHRLVAISGMALGVDQWGAAACIEADVPFIAALPCDGHAARWPAASQAEHQRLLAAAADVVVVSPGPYEPWKMRMRNAWMVAKATAALAVWDGSAGGTGHTVRLIQGRGLPWIELHPVLQTIEVHS